MLQLFYNVIFIYLIQSRFQDNIFFLVFSQKMTENDGNHLSLR